MRREPKKVKLVKVFRIRIEGDDLAALGMDSGNWLNDYRRRRKAAVRRKRRKADPQ